MLVGGGQAAGGGMVWGPPVGRLQKPREGRVGGGGAAKSCTFLRLNTFLLPIPSVSVSFVSNGTIQWQHHKRLLYLNTDQPGCTGKALWEPVMEGIIGKVVLRHSRGPKGNLNSGYSYPTLLGSCLSWRRDSYNKNKSYIPFAKSWHRMAKGHGLVRSAPCECLAPCPLQGQGQGCLSATFSGEARAWFQNKHQK